ncbi:MAG: hypothetical protein LN408_03280 [Candidatus Thermoplasmatota archaeon]|nr:hypothetical protein [Candidatus Thermoplasmatota archaeon]
MNFEYIKQWNQYVIVAESITIYIDSIRQKESSLNQLICDKGNEEVICLIDLQEMKFNEYIELLEELF